MAIIDIIILAVLLVFGIIGMIKGFLNTLISLFSAVASMTVAILCARPVAKFLNSIFGIISGIGGKIAGAIGGEIIPFQYYAEQGSPINTLDGVGLKTYLETDGLSFQERVYRLFIEDAKTFEVGEGGYSAADANVAQYIGERLAGVISLIIATVVVFILLRIAVLLLAKLFDALTKNRAISGLDRAMGLLFGLLKASIIICVVLAVFYLIANSTVQGWIDNSVVTKWMYKYVTELIDWIATKFDLPDFITGLFPALVQ